MPPLLIASLVVFFEVLSFGAIFPVLPDYCQQLGAAPDNLAIWSGLMFMMVALPRVVMNTVWGRLSDHIGRKKVLALVTCGTLGGSVMWAMAPSLGGTEETAGFLGISGLIWLLLSRLLAGIFQAQAALTTAIAADVTTPEKRAASMGLLGAAFGFGMLGGIAMGGFVGASIGLSYVGWASACAQGVSILMILFMLRETHPHHVPEAEQTGDAFEPEKLSVLLRRASIKRLMIVTLVLMSGHMVLVPTLRLASADWYNFDLNQTTWLFIVWMFVGVLVQGGAVRPMVKRFGDRKTLLYGVVLLAAGFFMLAGVGPNWLGGFWTSAVLIAIGGSLSTPALTALISHSVSEADQGAAQGLNQSFTALGRALSYVIAGLLYDVHSTLPYWIGGALVVVSGLLAMGVANENATAGEVEVEGAV
jgi:DHA1 family tetracycline resistance protein-like MFS transporter